MNLESYRVSLLQKRAELLGGASGKPLQWSMENNSGRQGDMADQASGTNEVHIHLKLKQTDAKILQAIEDALVRIEEGSYGVCRECGRFCDGCCFLGCHVPNIPVEACLRHSARRGRINS